MPSKRTRILLPMPGLKPLDYAIPDVLQDACVPGAIVQVPLGARQMIGVVWGDEGGSDPSVSDRPISDHKLKALLEVIDVPPITKALRQFIVWVADYYLSSPGAVLRMALSAREAFEPDATRRVWRLSGSVPTKLTPKRQAALTALVGACGTLRELAVIAGVSEAVMRALAASGALQEEQAMIPQPQPAQPDPAFHAPVLSAEQAAAATALREAVTAQRFAPTLLEGVTGSGKTEVYFEAVAQALVEGGQILVLVPEIAMTRQWLARFEARFGCLPAEWHSDLTASQRRRIWRNVAAGGASVVVGARSALFLPFANLRLIVVDEEHETSFKQEEGVTYNARDMAVVRARLEACPVVLTSATPALESRVNASRGRYKHLVLPARFGGAQLPAVQVVDMRQTPPQRGRWLCEPLSQAVAQTLARSEQALLFLNRRGYAPLTLCRKCGERMTCPTCSSWLVEHRRTNRLHCHHCGFACPIPKACPSCQEPDALVACGPGVERVAEEAAAQFPDAHVAVVTSDTITSPFKAQQLVEDVEAGRINILVGTQLIAKGYHFPDLTLVGVVDADLGLSGGDLRAAERTFQQMTQVAGRAGRAGKAGHVILQTYQPEAPVLQALAEGDGEGFYQAESVARERHGMPPFGRLAALIISGADQKAVAQTSQMLAQTAPHLPGLMILGPAPAPLALLRGRHRMRLLLKADRAVSIQAVLRQWLGGSSWPSGVRVAVDIDPYSFL